MYLVRSQVCWWLLTWQQSYFRCLVQAMAQNPLQGHSSVALQKFDCGGVFNLILQMGVKCLWLPFGSWDPAEEDPSIEGALIASQSCFKANPSFLTLHFCTWSSAEAGLEEYKAGAWLLHCSVLSTSLAGNLDIMQLRSLFSHNLHVLTKVWFQNEISVHSYCRAFSHSAVGSSEGIEVGVFHTFWWPEVLWSHGKTFSYYFFPAAVLFWPLWITCNDCSSWQCRAQERESRPRDGSSWKQKENWLSLDTLFCNYFPPGFYPCTWFSSGM